MKTSTRVATFALLLVGFTSENAAANSGAHEEGGHEEGFVGTTGTMGDPPQLRSWENCPACEGDGCEDCEEDCALENEGSLSLQERIEALEKELAELRRQLSAKPQQPDSSTAEHEALEKRIGALEGELGSLREKLGENGGWKLQLKPIGLSWPVMNGASHPTVLGLLELDGRYIWANHLGVGASATVLGFWFTDDDQGDSAQPWAGSGRLYASADWKHLAVTLGPKTSYFQNPTDDRQGFRVITVLVGLQWQPKQWLVLEGNIGPALASELQRLSGLWIGFSAGTPLFPKWW